MNTSQHRRMPCKLTWFRNYLRPVATKTSIQPWMCFPDIYLATLPQKMLKHLPSLIFNVMTKHAYLPTTINSDNWSAFVSQLTKEVADVLWQTLEHTTTKHAKTINILDKTSASLKKKHDRNRRTTINVAQVSQHCCPKFQHVLRTSIGCEHIRVFPGHVLYNVPDLKTGTHLQEPSKPNSQMSFIKPKWLSKMYAKKQCKPTTKKNNIRQKTNASKLKERDYVWVLQHQADHHATEILLTDLCRIEPYINEKALPNSNYLVRKIGTDKTQIHQRIILQSFIPRRTNHVARIEFRCRSYQ